MKNRDFFFFKFYKMFSFTIVGSDYLCVLYSKSVLPIIYNGCLFTQMWKILGCDRIISLRPEFLGPIQLA